MKKNGFVFIETIIAIVVLTSSLLLLYKTFTKILQLEKTRVNFDDIAYIYRTWNIKNKLDKLNLLTVIKDISLTENNYFMTVGMDTEKLFENKENEEKFFSKLLEDYEVNQMILIKENKIDNLKQCTLECSFDSECVEHENCNSLYLKVNEGLINFLDTLYIDVSCNYVLVIEYNTCNKYNTNCKNYYSWVSV